MANVTSNAPVNPYQTLASNIYAYVTGKTRISPRSVNLNAASPLAMITNGSLGAGLTGSTVSGAIILPQYCKIFKVAIGYKSSDLFDGTETFNIVVDSAGDYNSSAADGSAGRLASGTPFGFSAGYTASYTAGAVQTTADGDNSEVRAHPAGQGLGYPTNFGAVGNCLWAADQPISVKTFPSGGTTGGGAVLAPTNWDAVYAAGTILSLRAVTTASTGSVTGLCITLFVQSVDAKYPTNDRSIPLYSY